MWTTTYNILGEGDVSRGKKYAMVIGYGVMATDASKSEYTNEDVVNFINELGGRQEFEKPDSQIVRAIEALATENQLVTVENVKYILQQLHQEAQPAQNQTTPSSSPPVSWSIWK